MTSTLNQADLDHMLTRGADDWLALSGARLFVTGGTGFVGKWLLESLIHANRELSLGAKVVVLSRNPGCFAEEAPWLAADTAVSLVGGDIRNFAFPDGEFTHAIHAATDVVASCSSLDTFDVTVGGTRRVLDFCVERSVTNLLLVSSGAVYGGQPLTVDHISEDYSGAPLTTDPKSAYGNGKRASEWLAATYAAEKGLSCKIARCFAFVGPYLALDKHFAVGNFMRDVLSGKPILIGGDGTPLRSYLYAADLAVWLWAILLRGQIGRPYNVGSDHALSIRDLANTVIRVAGLSGMEINVARSPVTGQIAERYVPDVSRARNELRLDVWLSLEEALRRSINWYRPQFRR